MTEKTKEEFGRCGICGAEMKNLKPDEESYCGCEELSAEERYN